MPHSHRFISIDKNGVSVYEARADVGSGKNRQTATKRIHGTEEEAYILSVELEKSLRSSPKVSIDLTLEDYFYYIYLPKLEKGIGGGKGPATKEHITNVTKNFEKHIRPYHGTMKLKKLTETQIHKLIRESTAPGNTHKYYRALLNSAYSDGYMPTRFDLRKQKVRHKENHRQKVMVWSTAEFLDALEKVRGEELVELYLLISSCGARCEEALAITPRNMFMIERGGADGGKRPLLAFNICQAYTDKDGVKETKTQESTRITPSLLFLQNRIIELVEETKPIIEKVGEDAFLIRFHSGYRREMQPRYEERFIRGSRAEVMMEVDRLAETEGFGRFPKMERAGDTGYIVKLFKGYECQIMKKYEEVVFRGGEHEVRKYALERWLDTRVMPCTHSYLLGRWKHVLAKKGIRYMPPYAMRKFSATVTTAADVDAAHVQKLFGHTTYDTTFENYIQVNLDNYVDVAEKVDAYMTAPDRSKSAQIKEISW